MAAAAMPPIEKHRVRDRQPMHPATQIGPMRLRDQMNMIAHQHETKDGNLKTPSRFLQKLKKARPIAIIPKDPLPGVAPRAEMIDRILKRPLSSPLGVPPRIGGSC